MGLFSKSAGGHTYTSERRMRQQIRSMRRRGYAVKSATVTRSGGLLGRFGRKSRCSVIYERPLVIRLLAEDKRQLEIAAHEQGPTRSALVLRAMQEYLPLPAARREQ